MSSSLGMATGELQPITPQQNPQGGDSLWKEAWKRLLKDKIAVFGGVVIVLLIFISVFAGYLSPHDPDKQYANGTSSFGLPLPIGAQGRMMTMTLSEAPTRDYSVPSTIVFSSDSNVDTADYVFTARQNIAFKKGEKTATFAVNPRQPDMAKAPDQVQLEPTGTDLAGLSIPIASINMESTERFPMGTDSSGRDVLSRLIYGARVSLQVGVIAVGLAIVIGSVLGLISGYFGGWVDALIMRFTDIMMAFPDLLLVMAIVAIINPAEIGFFNTLRTWGFTPEVIFICMAISVVSWTQYARLVRSQVLTVREMEFVEASRSLGASDTYIMFRHILPNVIAPIIVVGTMGIAGAIMTEASLSFLGFGVKAPTASWGSMINESLGFFRDAPWIPLIPGLAIAITVFAFNLFGDGVRDALDPRLK